MVISALVFGLLGSFHCIGMCGPIAFMLPVTRDNNYKKALQVAIYHLGRLLAYSTIGIFFGLIGKSLNLFGMQQQLSIAVGIAMIALIMFPRIMGKGQLPGPLSKVVSRLRTSLGKALKRKKLGTFFSIGLLNGFLPCGLVYMAVLGAVALGSTWNGGLYMFLFGLGTVPLMTSAIYFQGILKKVNKRHIQRLVPIAVVSIGLLFILRGMGLGIPFISPEPVEATVTTQGAHPNPLQVQCH